MNARTLLLTTAILLLPRPPAFAADYPVNRWVKLETKNDFRGYTWASPVYVPARKQIIHWGAVRNIYRVPLENRDDVLAFDPDRGDWVGDYPATPDLKPSHSVGQTGIGTSIRGTAAMQDNGRPTPSMYVNAACWDAKRGRVVYAMKGLMAAYDPAAKTWSDMKAAAVIYGTEYPGGPPVYGAGMAYDPVNDEIVMFPHWSGAGDPKNIDRRAETGEVSGHLGTLVFSYRDRRWRRTKPAAEPPPRCAAPLVYDPGSRCLVMFGGRNGIVRTDLEPGFHLGAAPGALNDTWLYDTGSRTWRELETSRRPPTTDLPNLFRETGTGTVFLATFTEEGRKKTPATCTFWTLDIERASWHRRLRLELDFEPACRRVYASRTPLFCVGYDPDRRLLVLTQNRREGTRVTQDTYALQLDLGAMPAEPAPAWRPPPPIRPIAWPAPDPEHEQRLRRLPANEWVKLEPRPGEEVRRDWGNVGFDPVENRLYYFGGGHSTYQVNDVAVYDVAANTWIHTVGEHNDFIPPVGWGGVTMGFRGGHHAHHQRNEYQAVDGRMYVSIGGNAGYLGWSSADKKPGMSWFFDARAGGVWRMKKVACDLGPGVERPWGNPHLSDAAGKIHCLELVPKSRYARELKAAYYCVFDAAAGRLSVRAIPRPWPLRVGEMRNFCLVPDEKHIYYYEYTKPRKDHPGTRRLWRYDIAANRFAAVDCAPLPPKGRMPTLEYIAGQNALFAVVQPEGASRKQQEQWIYRTGEHRWHRLPIEGVSPVLQTPYGQMAYVPRYGVLINAAKYLTAMRVDIDGRANAGN